MERYVVIHGHFYQPPRENPWLEAIEIQDSAYPYHDWNERITAECYAPNGASRILDGEGRIRRIVNNYSRISFNFGPTLLAWLERWAPETYKAILEADRESAQRFSGHGSAMAQAYNHPIMPLADSRDKGTQVLWGIRDFEHRFGRKPEGMWLPETAVDLETLDIMAKHGIRFTILAPHQARRVKPTEGGEWRDVSGSKVDPTTAYTVRLPSGSTIAVFFYDGPIARAVAFEGLLTRGENLVERLMEGFNDSRPWPQLVHIATDGETYGHHHAHGDMALAYALEHLEANGGATLTNYGEFLDRHPPSHEAEVIESTSWSCAHGVERWRSNCGCNSGGRPTWNQGWRAPLLVALDSLGERVARGFEAAASQYLRDPWAARDGYIDVVLDRSPEALWRFMEAHAKRELKEEEVVTVLKLLELQRHALLMYTSCGWFFDDISGTETVQVLQYAGRAIQLARETLGEDLEPSFLGVLEGAKSNLPAHRDGRLVYEKFVRRAVVDLERVGAHYALSSLFHAYGDRDVVYCYDVEREDHHSMTLGKSKLALGRIRISSQITRESRRVTFGVVHLGDHNLGGGVREYRGEEAYRALVSEISESFKRGDFPGLVRVVDRNFGSGTYSLTLLFRDEQRRILRLLLQPTVAEAEAAFHQTYKNHASLMHFMRRLAVPIPRALEVAAEYSLNAALKGALEPEAFDIAAVRNLLEEAKALKVELDAPGLGYALRQAVEGLAEEFRRNPRDLEVLRRLDDAAGLAESMPTEVQLWRAQNIYYDILHTSYPEARGRAEAGDEGAREWVDSFVALGEKLSVRVE